MTYSLSSKSIDTLVFAAPRPSPPRVRLGQRWCNNILSKHPLSIHWATFGQLASGLISTFGTHGFVRR